MKKNTLLLLSLFSSFIMTAQFQLPIDGECPPGSNLYYFDMDGDGYGNPNSPVCSDYPPLNASPNNFDCNDNDPSIYPGAPELADGKDNDCDGLIDEGLATPPAIPPAITVTKYCDYTTLTRAVPPSGVTYYWQSSNSGTSTSSSALSVNRTSGTIYYLRARNNSSLLWSSARSVSYTIDSCPEPVPATAFSNENYIYTRTYQQPYSVSPSNPFVNDVIESITYFDGLGRPLQHIGIKQAGGNTYEDIVTHVGYDQYGREDKKYLPYPDATTTGGLIKTGDIALKTKTYYYNNYLADFPGLTAPTSNPFSEIRFEASPLNRPLEQGAPGKDWRVLASDDSGHTVKIEYQANTSSEVRLYKVSLSSTYVPTLIQSTTSYYLPGELFKTITKDENWTAGLNNTTVEFKDKQGRVVLKRTYANTDLNNDGDTTDSNEQQVPHDTYYVYDDYGNLTYVLPPKVITSNAITTTVLENLSYQYRYDHKNRLIEKKIPGKGTQTNWESIVYNKLDQPIMTQDPNLKALNQWLFTKYDAFGRVAYTGLVTRLASRTTLQTEANNNAIQFEERSSSRTLGGTSIYYTNNAYPGAYSPASVITEVHTENYYDTYLSSAAQAGIVVPTTNSVGEIISISTKGLPTVGKVRVLGTSNWITTVTAYEKKGRAVWSKSINSYLGTTDMVESDIDFIGNVLSSKATHSRTGQNTIITTDTFTYDHVNRLKKHIQSINGSSAEVIAENTYSKTGELIAKGVGNIASSISRLQSVDYNYNIRGWLKGINNSGGSSSLLTLGTGDLFGFQINYNSPTDMTKALYNGNISQTLWRTKNTDLVQRSYLYTYDALNRITRAVSNDGKFDLGTSTAPITYDKNGNILKLQRKGAIVASPVYSTSSHYGTMDNLTYTYDNGNKLFKVEDSGNGIYGFKNGVNVVTEYTYDLHGNLISDANKGITTVLYNYLNMPSEIKFNGSNTQKINYTYSADGIKLRKATNNGGVISTTDYASNFVYENNLLKQFYHPQGYVEPKGTGWQYVYQYRDIWGNTRITYADDDNSGSVTSAEIRREQNFYPFGLEHKGYNGYSHGVKNNLKTYQGQEFTEDLGLNTHEWKYRMSDPSIGRFWQVDPLAEEYTYNSTYAFQENKMGMGVELEGLEYASWDIVKYISTKASVYLSTTAGARNLVGSGLGNTIKASVTGVESNSSNSGVGGMTVSQVQDISAVGSGLGTISTELANTAVQVVRDGANGLENTGDVITTAGIVTLQPEIVAAGQALSSTGTAIHIGLDVAEGNYSKAVERVTVEAVTGGLGSLAKKAAETETAKVLLDAHIEGYKKVYNDHLSPLVVPTIPASPPPKGN